MWLTIISHIYLQFEEKVGKRCRKGSAAGAVSNCSPAEPSCGMSRGGSVGGRGRGRPPKRGRGGGCGRGKKQELDASTTGELGTLYTIFLSLSIIKPIKVYKIKTFHKHTYLKKNNNCDDL